MTLREALTSVDLDKVFRIINEKDQGYIAECDRPTLETTRNAYSSVVKELLSKPTAPPYKMPWCIREQTDWYDGHKYTDVCFRNPSYVAPDEKLKPWGGDGKTPIPEGRYDCNAEIHNEFFACGFTTWSEVIDTEIVNEIGCSLETAIAELLWELTFYGWTEEKQAEFVKEISDRLDEVKDEIGSDLETVKEKLKDLKQ